jgi:glyoxylase-like metal-dependent hydrolase (beta-lactamase superfamily II)
MRHAPYHNTHEPLLTTPRSGLGLGPACRTIQLHSLSTSPKSGIGQRAILVCTPAGNLLWDCLTFLDRATAEWIHGLGGLAAIAISHPHYYSTHLLWAAVFQCPVYLSADDEQWLCRADAADPVRRFVPVGQREADVLLPLPIKLLKLGGHFPGSLVCLVDGALLVADTLVTTPSGLGHWKDKPRPIGMNSFAFMWSIPNVRPCERRERENCPLTPDRR